MNHRAIVVTPSMRAFCTRLRANAALGFNGGWVNLSYLMSCSGYHQETGTRCIYTRDVGHHTSGWFKNPEYERCHHLSLSFGAERDPSKPGPFCQRTARLWVRLFFGAWQRYIWEESPKTPEGRRLEVRHYRVFCDPAWQPIIPRGEVYSTELTELGWRSWSEQQTARSTVTE